MERTYALEILTPERQFFSGQVQALTIPAPDGALTVLAGHAPLIVPLVVGVLRIKQDDVWQEAFTSEGFMEVRSSSVLVFTQACEWPQEIDARRAQAAEQRAAERLRQKGIEIAHMDLVSPMLGLETAITGVAELLRASQAALALRKEREAV